jgi:hypothetical protein
MKRIDPELLESAYLSQGYIVFVLNDGRVAQELLKGSRDYEVFLGQGDLGELRFASEHGFTFDGSRNIVPYPLSSLFEDVVEVVTKNK